MVETGRQVLAMNCGSSSVKAALLDAETGARTVSALVDRIGRPDGRLTVRRVSGEEHATAAPADHAVAVAAVLGALTEREQALVAGVGHRVVHGGPRHEHPTLVDDAVLEDLRGLVALAPLHVPANLAGLESALAELPDLPHVAVFDTAFHLTLPEVAHRYAVPERWYAEHGARRFGFHGLSHQFVSGRAARLLGRPLEELRLVTLHLGNGCSAAAVKGGRSVDTTMGFTPLEGLVMGTRSGDIDPGLLAHVAEREGLSLAEVVETLNHDSGLLGVSGLSNDVRVLTEAEEAGSAPARLALELFCYRAAKTVAAYTVPLGGLDAVVFTGGIGEHSARVRAGILDLLDHLGLVVDPVRNAADGSPAGGRISQPGPVTAWVVPTDEELVIARETSSLIG